MATNQEKFNALYDSGTPGIDGVKFDGALYKQAKEAAASANQAEATSGALLDRFTAGVPGVRFEGDLYGYLRRIEQVCITNTAVIQNLVAALANVTGGQAFSEARLMDGIAATLQENLPEEPANELETV